MSFKISCKCYRSNWTSLDTVTFSRPTKFS